MNKGTTATPQNWFVRHTQKQKVKKETKEETKREIKKLRKKVAAFQVHFLSLFSTTQVLLNMNITISYKKLLSLFLHERTTSL